MWFKNLRVYKIPAHWALSPADIESALQTCAHVPLMPSQAVGHGWAPIFDDKLLHVVGQQMLVSLTTDKKLLPSSVIKPAIAEQVKKFTHEVGRKPGKKAKQEIVEDVIAGLLPKAFTATTKTLAWIDPVNGWLVVNTASSAHADTLVRTLVKSFERLPLETLHLSQDPMVVMTHWLAHDAAPAGFTVDRDVELRSPDASKSTVRYSRHNLDRDDLRQHITSGKYCTRLSLTWADRISFVMHDKFVIKGVVVLDLLKEDRADGFADEREEFDADFTLMAGELNGMLTALLAAFGGVRKFDAPAAEDDLF